MRSGKEKAGRNWQLVRECGDILSSQSSFLLTDLTSCGLREECLCVLIMHAGEVTREAWEATSEGLNNKPCRVYRAHLIWGRI